MLVIKKGNIYLTKGDSAYIDIPFTGYKLGTGDVIEVHVRAEENDTSTLLFEGDITVDAENNTATWHISPTDTEDAPNEEYYWDAQIKTASGEKFTYIADKKLILTPSMTR